MGWTVWSTGYVGVWGQVIRMLMLQLGALTFEICELLYNEPKRRPETLRALQAEGGCKDTPPMIPLRTASVSLLTVCFGSSKRVHPQSLRILHIYIYISVAHGPHMHSGMGLRLR